MPDRSAKAKENATPPLFTLSFLLVVTSLDSSGTLGPITTQCSYTVRKDPLNDLGALMFLKNVLKFGLKNLEK